MGMVICDNKIVSLPSCNYLTIHTALTSGGPLLQEQLALRSYSRKLTAHSKEPNCFEIFLAAQEAWILEGTLFLRSISLWTHTQRSNVSQPEPLAGIRYCLLTAITAHGEPTPKVAEQSAECFLRGPVRTVLTAKSVYRGPHSAAIV